MAATRLRDAIGFGPWNADWAAEHPEWWALALSAAMWISMLTHAPASHGWALCLSPSHAGFAGSFRAGWETGSLASLLAGWGVMTVAMMPPLAIPLIRHVAARSFAARRNRSVGAFLAGLLGVWLLLGVAALTVLGGAQTASLGDADVAAAGLLLAALWQLSPMKRAAILRCHRTAPLAADGWRADRDCFRYGLNHGIDCVASCWALMLAMTLAPHGPVIGIGIQSIALTERLSRRPRLGLSAAILASCAVATLARVPM